MVVVIIAVCCALLIKKKTNAPSITATVEMNGESREVGDEDTINRIPSFSSQEFDELRKEDTSCGMRSRVKYSGKKGK